jgi:hypothetical protein
MYYTDLKRKIYRKVIKSDNETNTFLIFRYNGCSQRCIVDLDLVGLLHG